MAWHIKLRSPNDNDSTKLERVVLALFNKYDAQIVAPINPSENLNNGVYEIQGKGAIISMMCRDGNQIRITVCEQPKETLAALLTFVGFKETSRHFGRLKSDFETTLNDYLVK